MAEVTRVPLQPVSKGSLVMLFLGILIGMAISGAAAWYMLPQGVDVDEVRAGAGANPTVEDVVFLRYTGKLDNGTVFDQSQDSPWPIPGIMPDGQPMQLSGVVPGFREAVLQMQKGGKYTVWIPAEKAYGDAPPPGSPIPPNSDLTFEIELIDFLSLDEANRRVQQLQQAMMQRQLEQGGAADPATPGAAPAPPEAPAEAPAGTQ